MLNDIYEDRNRLLLIIKNLEAELQDYKMRLAKIAALVHPR